MLKINKQVTTFFLGFVFLFFPLSSFAWYALGHMVVAEIAYQHLTPTARVEVDKLTVFFNKEYSVSHTLVDMSYWPDELRKQKIDMFSHWHYIDLSFSDDNTPVINVADRDNAVWTLEKMTAVIRNKQANPYERARFLAFYTHIVGDLHQPLHAAARISAEHPKGDQGGNLFFVKMNGERKTLHAVWDGVFDELSGRPDPAVARAQASVLVSLYPPAFFGARSHDLEPKHWAQEGLEKAQNQFNERGF